MALQTAVIAHLDHQPGDVIAQRYVLQRKLGEGGMGVVWSAHSTALGVDVALKMLRPELADTQAVERMAREARTAAQLGHPAMVRVLDFGTSELGQPFIAMELLQGEELHTRLQREQRLPAPTAVALLLPIIDGLGIAHEKGIVHRDIKPENIFIATDGQRRVQPKVLDFGIAKLGQEQTVTRLTQAGTVMGSPYYLSPEQAEGLESIDFRCDIWSVGVVLYEAVTGVPPFAADNYNALMRSILRDSPTPITELAAGDAQLWMIIGRCLQKDREQRWASMWELGEALALWLFERGVRVDAASRSLRHAWLDGGLTGVQILVASDAPNHGTLPAPPLVVTELPPGITREPPPSTLAKTLVRPRRRRRQRLALALTALASLAALGLTAWVLRGDARRAPPPRLTQAEVSRPAAVSAPMAAMTAPDPPLVPETLALAAPPPGASAPTPSAPLPQASAPRVTRPKVATSARARPPVRRNEEFGF